ncbi:PREDICTED: serine/threonine-protein phosphatase 7 long form homolog [Erythranthe guttata]|uniref:serine/threonine-protein phosphatase 7 long form homolog n=1 Tax=Erythranthe guttata TaxID=4155 RepID=UPI00064DB170|nr:PREDICTED: serine/threonine-protein phosphatase 7 long form homolog [Erythranthe guttata]|eukprot:XP_012844365.1 PREDICTED: serine/threonine-protein phosphatase 7 long form homolog [Erythranthe guttata]
MENAVYGPRDPSLLYLQNDHRSSALTESNMDTSIRVRRSDHGIWSVFHRPHNPHPHPRVLSYLVQMKLYGVYRCRRMQADWALITALVERWRQETHTFHLRVGEVTVTLQDVALIYGLPVDGRPVIGVDTHRRTREWQQYCMTWLGFTPDSSKIKGSKLSVKALSEYLINNPVLDNSTYEHLIHYTRGIAFLIVGGIMCPDHTGDSIPLMYLRHLEDLDALDGLHRRWSPEFDEEVTLLAATLGKQNLLPHLFSEPKSKGFECEFGIGSFMKLVEDIVNYM